MSYKSDCLELGLGAFKQLGVQRSDYSNKNYEFIKMNFRESITMNFSKGLRALVLGILILPGIASAAVIDLANSQLNGNTVNDYSAEGLVDFDFLIDNSGLTVLAIDLSASEMAAGQISLRFAGLSSFVNGIESITVSAGTGPAVGISFVGDALDSSDNNIALNVTPTLTELNFVPPETGVFTVGALGSGTVDWTLSFPTTTNTLKLFLAVKESPVVVPLPAGVWLLMSALAGLGLTRRKR